MFPTTKPFRYQTKPYKPKKCEKSFVKALNAAQLNGSFGKRSISKNIVKRHVLLQKIVPSEEYLHHVFLGFTQNGQFLLSYCFTDNLMFLHIWIFDYDKPLKLVGKHVIFTSTHSHNHLDDLYESTALYVYQWPSDDHHLLILTIPEHPIPSIVNAIVLHVSIQGSCILDPGIMSFSVVGWGHRHSFFDRKDTRGLEDYLSPGLLMFKSKICTFHTGTEIVCLEIQKKKIITKILDVERLLVEALECPKREEDWLRLTTYELLVSGIHHEPTSVQTFVHAVIRDRWNFQTFREFVLDWNTGKGSHTLEECQVILGPNGKKKAYVQSALEQLISLQKESEIYYLDNMQFVECQISLNILNSPVDNVSVTLAHSPTICPVACILPPASSTSSSPGPYRV